MQSLQGFAQQQFESNKVCGKRHGGCDRTLTGPVYLESAQIHIRRGGQSRNGAP